MWSKIKNIKLPISTKLTLLYTAILFCILLLTSILTVGGLHYLLHSQAKNDLEISARNITAYLAAGNPVNRNLFAENILAPGVTIRLFDSEGDLILSNVPQTSGRGKSMPKDETDDHLFTMALLSKDSLRIIREGGAHFYAVTKQARQGGNVYQMHLFQPISDQAQFIIKLAKVLIVTNLIGLLFAVVSGMFISRKILRPIRDITATARQIEINDLDKRIPPGGSNDELGELSKTFNSMLNRIQAGIEQQRRFVSDASHELRTPITVIGGYANMLDRWGKEDISALNEGIEAIKSETANMHELIEKLLFLARTDQDKQTLNKSKLDVRPLIEEIAQETSLIAPNHHIVLRQNDPAAIYADYSLFKQMLRIFIENSVKYTPAGGSVSISSRRIESEPGHLEIIIEDTGIGIPEEEQSKIFDRFYRIDKSRSKNTGGTGLGLSIAKWIAERHDSPIQLASTPGKGTKVTVKIDFLRD